MDNFKELEAKALQVWTQGQPERDAKAEAVYRQFKEAVAEAVSKAIAKEGRGAKARVILGHDAVYMARLEKELFQQGYSLWHTVTPYGMDMVIHELPKPDPRGFPPPCTHDAGAH